MSIVYTYVQRRHLKPRISIANKREKEKQETKSNREKRVNTKTEKNIIEIKKKSKKRKTNREKHTQKFLFSKDDKLCRFNRFSRRLFCVPVRFVDSVTL